MLILVSGGAKSGKSDIAQKLAMGLSEGGKCYYIATTIPCDAEDWNRIQKHIKDREGLGFTTMECDRNILSCLECCDKNGSFLVDSSTALLMNELFPETLGYQMDESAIERCRHELCLFACSVRHCVIVSDFIYSDAERYNETTEIYRKGLAAIDRALASIADTVIEVCSGTITLQKGELP